MLHTVLSCAAATSNEAAHNAHILTIISMVMKQPAD